MRAMLRKTLLITLLGLAVAACTTSGDDDDDSSARCDAPVAPACQDEQIQQLFYTTNTDGNFTNTDNGGEFSTLVDATAGGFSGTESFLYGKFTANGLEKVVISDEESLDSMDWDIAFRRFVIRLNSGVAGPSCVSGAAVPGAFTDVTTADGIAFEEEGYFDTSCTLVEDGSGLPSSPDTITSGFWTYPGCVSMTDQVYVIALADGSYVKLQVEAYYASGQDGCDSSGTPGTNGGTLTVRWAYL